MMEFLTAWLKANEKALLEWKATIERLLAD